MHNVAWRGMTWHVDLRAQEGCAETISANVLNYKVLAINTFHLIRPALNLLTQSLPWVGNVLEIRL